MLVRAARPSRGRWRTAPIRWSAGSKSMAKAVRRDIHKMHAFVRFREVADGRRHALRRLVRARASYRPRRRGLLRRALRQHALVDPDARTVDPLGRRDADRRPGRDARATRPRAIRSRRCGRPIMPSSSIRRGSRSARCSRKCRKKYWKNMPETALVAGSDRGRAGAGERDGRAAQEPATDVGDNVETSWEAVRDEAMTAPAATSTNAPPRPCSAKARSTPRSCSSASSRATRRIWPAGRSSARPGQLFDRALAEAGIDRADDLRHQCGQAFQVRAARQAPHPFASPTPARSRPAAGGSSRSAR